MYIIIEGLLYKVSKKDYQKFCDIMEIKIFTEKENSFIENLQTKYKVIQYRIPCFMS